MSIPILQGTLSKGNEGQQDLNRNPNQAGTVALLDVKAAHS
jgi:hypothetical protein